MLTIACKYKVYLLSIDVKHSLPCTPHWLASTSQCIYMLAQSLYNYTTMPTAQVRLAVATQEKVDALLKAASGAAAESAQHRHGSRSTSATSSPLEDGLHSSSVEHDWDVRKSFGADVDAGKRHQVNGRLQAIPGARTAAVMLSILY